jgi:hypothetical protein
MPDISKYSMVIEIMSIWEGIDRSAFQSNVKTLWRISKDGFRFHGPTISRGDHPLSNSAKVERRLASDFAFLACTTTKPEGVTAAAVKWIEETQRLQITVAANQGIPASTIQALTGLLDDLAKRARRELTKRDTFARCQHTIIDLHRDRVLGRLGLTRAEGRNYVNISQKLALLKQLATTQSGRIAQAKDTYLIGLLDLLEQAIQTTKSATTDSVAEYEAIGIIFHTSRVIVVGHGKKLEELCRSVDKNGACIGDRVYRELRALANYWRIFRDLARLAGHQRELFLNAKLNVPVLPRSTLSNASQKAVHAEVQILIDFELHPKDRPRFIQASKKPCFLCYCFMRAHGFHDVSQSHGEVYKNWMVPELTEYTDAVMNNLNVALRGVATALSAEARRSKLPRPKGIYQQIQQTVTKLLLDDNVSLSVTTASLDSLSLNGEDVKLVTQQPHLSEAASDRVEGQPTHQDDTCDEVRMRRSIEPVDSGRVSIASMTPSADPLQPCHESILKCIVPAGQLGHLQIHDMKIFLELEEAPIRDEIPPEASFSIKARTSLPAENLPILDVEELVGDIVIARAHEDETLRFVLRHGGRYYLADVVW